MLYRTAVAGATGAALCYYQMQVADPRALLTVGLAHGVASAAGGLVRDGVNASSEIGSWAALAELGVCAGAAYFIGMQPSVNPNYYTGTPMQWAGRAAGSQAIGNVVANGFEIGDYFQQVTQPFKSELAYFTTSSK